MTVALPVLYSFRRCPYAMRARMALYTAKIPHEHREVSLKNKPLELLALSPKGTVPVMQLEDGSLFEESLDIMKWALKTEHLQADDNLIITENDTIFKKALDRYKYPGRYAEEIGTNYREQCEQFLEKLEIQLAPFLKGTTARFIDMALFPFIRQLSMVDINWFNAQPYPCIKTWLEFFISSHLFAEIMKKYSPWSPGDEPTLVTF